MTNPQTVKLSNRYAVEARRLNALVKAARKSGDEQVLVSLEPLVMRNDWESSAYWDDKERKFFIPDSSIMACIRAGATASKKGRDIDRAVIMSETQAFVDTKHFKSLDDAWEDEKFRLEGPAKVPPKTGSLIWKCRCMMPTGWVISFSLEYDELMFPGKSLADAIDAAGKMQGMGGWRPKFGRFLAECKSS